MGEQRCIPLYRFDHKLPSKKSGGHLGLWFDKFFDAWRVEKIRNGDPYWSVQADSGAKGNPKTQWLGELVGAAGGSGGLLAESVRRMLRMVEANSGRWRLFRAESRFVTGLGRRHPVENGFAWHPTLGVPYLPGSSVKGLVRAWAREAGVSAGEVLQLFGSTDSGDRPSGEPAPNGRGAVVFLDALPYRAPKLAIDVMTPHYAQWTVQEPPGDWNSPVPIPFLVVEQGATFVFGVLPAGGASGDDLDRVVGWLTEALYWAGAGAKTAVGYGRMVPDGTAEREVRKALDEEKAATRRAAEEAARLEKMSPLDRELEEVRQAYPQYTEQQTYLAWLEEVLKGGRWRDDPARRLEVLYRIKGEMERAGVWRMPTSQKQVQKKSFARVLKVRELIEKTEAELGGEEGKS